jgi:hypothetical protein
MTMEAGGAPWVAAAGWPSGMGPPRPPGVVFAGFPARREVPPYLGPEPTPSRPLVWPLVCAYGAVALVYVVRAGLYLQRWSLDRTLVSDGPSPRLDQQIHSSQHLLLIAFWALNLTLAATVIVHVLWSVRRRPKARRARGAAYVELPTAWTLPIPFQLVSLALLIAALSISLHGAVSATTPLVALPGARRFEFIGSDLWVAFWVVAMIRPILTNAAHDRRLAWSWSYRQNPAAMVPAPPTPGVLRARPMGEPATLGWARRTAPLALVLVLSLIVTIAGVSELLVGQYGRQGLPWLLASLVVDGLVLWAFRRQYRRRRAA